MLLKATKNGSLDGSFEANSTDSDFYPDELDQRDYPMVKFWRLQDWKKHSTAKDADIDKKSNPKGSVQSSQCINVAMLYIEDEQGDPISGYKATEIRSIAYRVFRELQERNMAPLTWGTIRSQASKYYHREMNKAFPILGLCADRWKADRLASKNYSSWYGTHGHAEIVPKLEDDQTSNVSIGQKRYRRQRHISPKKKAKTVNDGPSPCMDELST